MARFALVLFCLLTASPSVYAEKFESPQETYRALIDKHPGKFSSESQSSSHILYLTRKDGGHIGALSYTIEEDTLHLSYIHVEVESRQSGVATLLMAKVLIDHPEIRCVEGTLAGVNEQVFEQKLSEGKSLEAAGKLTPAYRMLSRWGFTQAEKRKAQVQACKAE